MKKSKAEIKEDSEVYRLRKKCGLPQIKKGKRRCLKCDVSFVSADLFREKLCKNCREVNERYG